MARLQNKNDALHVLHIYRTYFPDPPGGSQESIRQICLSTSALGIEAKVFTLSPQPIPKKINAIEAKVVRCRSWAAPASCDLGGLDAVMQFRALSNWADVIHYHFPWPFADVLRLFGARNKPSVMTYHSDIVRQRYLGKIYGPLMRKTLQGMSAVVATSPAYAATSPVLTQHVHAKNLKTIPLGIVDNESDVTGSQTNEHTLARLNLGDRPFVLALGVLRYYKGLHTLIEAASKIDGMVVIAGSGPEGPTLISQANRLATTNIVFAGQISEAEKVSLLRQCRALVLPSHMRSEAFGMVLVEAAMFGKPMVCCEIGSGTTFVNKHGETGLVVPPESPHELAMACNSLLNNKAAAISMGAAARARYEQLFSGAALGRAYADLYREVVTK
jgi:glycosyltransferase involved in cell wall biosynthesis